MFDLNSESELASLAKSFNINILSFAELISEFTKKGSWEEEAKAIA